MTNPTDRESLADATNPLGLDGIEFIEFATAQPQAFGQVLEMMGFRPVARHRSREVLLIDEPSIGLSPMVVADVFKLLRQLADQGTTVLMVEQNVKSALKMADEAIALESGRLVLHRPASELLADPDIERLFLGGAHAITTH